MPDPPSSTRDQILDAAIDLFARQGYKSTTIAQIEQGAGLSPGSGGLYRHFPSKQALLEASIERARQRRTIPTVEHSVLFDLDRPAEALRAIAEFGLAACRADRALYQLFMRPADDVTLTVAVADVQREFFENPINGVAVWIDLFTNAGRFRKVDSLAVSANALAGLSWHFMTTDLLAIPMAGMDDERFLATWVDTWMTYLRVGPNPA